MLNEVLKKIDANRISMPFKNEIMSFDFFNLISEKDHPVLTNRNLDIKDIEYSFGKEDFISAFTKVQIFEDKKHNKKINIIVAKNNNVITISSDSEEDYIFELLSRYQEYYAKKHYISSCLMN